MPHREPIEFELQLELPGLNIEFNDLHSQIAEGTLIHVI
jgi:hypothetical protein